MSTVASNGAVANATMGHIVRPLSDEDLSILALETQTVAGHTCKVVLLDREIDIDRLRSSVGSRLNRAPEFSTYLRDVDGEPSWVLGPPPDLAAHVVECGKNERVDEGGLRDRIANLFEQRLDRRRPLWRVDAIPRLAGGGTALICRIHHALADGQTVMHMIGSALWDEDPSSQACSHQPGVQPSGGEQSVPPAHHRLEGLLAAAREAPQPWLRSPFNGHIGARRAVALATAELQALKRVAHHTHGATVNDAVLTVVAGGVRRWLEAHHGQLGSLRVKVPVSLHNVPLDGSKPDVDEGNRDSFFLVDLPLGSADPLERLAAIRDATRIRKAGHDAQHLDSLMHQLAHTPRLRQFAERVLAHPRSFALNVSNVAGPRRAPQVLGATVRALYSLAEIREHHALRVAVVSLADTLNFGLIADPTLIGDVERLADDIGAEAQELAARVQPV